MKVAWQFCYRTWLVTHYPVGNNGFEPSNFVLVSTIQLKNPIFCIKGNSKQTNIYIRVGLNGQYRNEVKLRSKTIDK